MLATTQARMDRILSRTADYLTAGQQAALKEVVEHELRAQDLDTRHACAEAVAAIDPDDYTAVHRAACVVTLHRAHQACINSEAV